MKKINNTIFFLTFFQINIIEFNEDEDDEALDEEFDDRTGTDKLLHSSMPDTMLILEDNNLKLLSFLMLTLEVDLTSLVALLVLLNK